MKDKFRLYCLTFLLLTICGYQVVACTTFLISGKATADGKPILFKNRDAGQMQNSLAYFNDGKYKYIGLINGDETRNTMVWGGYNETGFAIINSAAYNNNVGDTSKIMDQEGVIMKLALKTCRTIGDFEKLLDSLPKPMGADANFGVIDACGGAAYYETGNYRFKKFDVNDPKVAPDGILVRTNYSTSADVKKGFGFCRYNTAVDALNKAVREKDLSPHFLFNSISRNLTHSLTKTDLLAEMPKQKDIPEFKFFMDYIPRVSTASAVMIVGAKDKKHAGNAMMWTILGFPLTSVAIPAWIAGGDRLPEAVSMQKDLKSPICTAALRLKDECFPIKYDDGEKYINLSVVMNLQNTGYMQLLQPIENEIFVKADLLMDGLERGGKSKKDIQYFYDWVDQFLSAKFHEQFGINLFDK